MKLSSYFENKDTIIYARLIVVIVPLIIFGYGKAISSVRAFVIVTYIPINISIPNVILARRRYPNLPLYTALARWSENQLRLPGWSQYPLAPDRPSGGAPRSGKRSEGGGLRLPGPTCSPQRSFDNPTVRVTVIDRVSVWAWPSIGGVVVLENAAAVDIEFLGLNPLDPPLCRLDDQHKEDTFCKRLLLLGATWWESQARRRTVKSAEEEDSRVIILMEDGEVPEPTVRERRWVSVAWPSTGGIWVAEFDTLNYSTVSNLEQENLLPCDTVRLTMARTMNERSAILREHFGAKFYQRLQDYNGLGYLNEWEKRIAAL